MDSNFKRIKTETRGSMTFRAETTPGEIALQHVRAIASVTGELVCIEEGTAPEAHHLLETVAGMCAVLSQEGHEEVEVQLDQDRLRVQAISWDHQWIYLDVVGPQSPTLGFKGRAQAAHRSWARSTQAPVGDL